MNMDVRQQQQAFQQQVQQTEEMMRTATQDLVNSITQLNNFTSKWFTYNVLAAQRSLLSITQLTPLSTTVSEQEQEDLQRGRELRLREEQQRRGTGWNGDEEQDRRIHVSGGVIQDKDDRKQQQQKEANK